MKQFVAAIKKELSFGLSIPALLWQVFFLGIPFCIVVYTSVHLAYDAPWYAVTMSHFTQLFTAAHFWILLRTLFVALFTASLCVFIAFPVAYFVALHVEDEYKNIFLFFLTLPFWTNFLIQVYSLFFLLVKHGLINIFLFII